MNFIQDHFPSILLGILAGVLYAGFLVASIKQRLSQNPGSLGQKQKFESPEIEREAQELAKNQAKRALVRSVLFFLLRYVFILWLLVFFLVKLQTSVVTCIIFFGVSFWVYIVLALKGKI
ncbi:MAG: hypothetical protein ABH827_01195 [bacterium]